MTDRDIDCLIQEHVFGQPVVCRDWPLRQDPECGGWEACREYDPKWPYDARGPVYVPEYGTWPPTIPPPVVGSDGTVYQKGAQAWVEPVPEYTTDREAAMRILDHVQTQLDGLWEIGVFAEVGVFAGGYWCNVEWEVDDREENELHCRTETDSTLPRAICLAVLRAKGVEA